MNVEPIKVLLVEDDPGDALLIQETLTLAGDSEMILEFAERLSAAIDRLANGDIGLVLLDLGLPDSQGIATLARLHSHAPDVPILVLTGYSDESLGVEAVREGAQDYLVKGEVDERSLARSIRYAVERKREGNRIVRQSSLLSAMNAVSKEALSSENEEELTSMFLRKAQEITCSEFGFVSEPKPAGRAETRAMIPSGWKIRAIPKSHTLPVSKIAEIREIWRSVLEAGRSQMNNHPIADPEVNGVVNGRLAITSFLAMPLRRGEQNVGMIGLANKRGSYDDADRKDVEALSGVFLEALYRRRAEDEVRRHRERLEQRVKERTNELTRLNERLSREIGDRVRAEQEVRASLKEREALLQEVHHRVKNNLQLVCSLLDLQQSRIDDSRTRAFLQDSERRVRSMALIHEQLYKSKDLNQINFARYLDDLTKAISDSYSPNGNSVSIIAMSDTVLLGVDTALPCGLIINELVSNCLKHAFAHHQKGQVRVEFRSDYPGTYTLIVGDNGEGLPEDWDDTNSQSLGLKLVRRLTSQLHGRIEVRTDEGTEFRIKFDTQQGGKRREIR